MSSSHLLSRCPSSQVSIPVVFIFGDSEENHFSLCIVIAPHLTLSLINFNWLLDAPISRLQPPTIFVLLLFVFVVEVTNANWLFHFINSIATVETRFVL
jgi:hypothetical protein